MPLQAQLLAEARGSTLESVRTWLDRRACNEHQVFRIICDLTSNEPLRILASQRRDRRDRMLSLRHLRGPIRQRRGAGTQALLALEQLLSRERGVRKLLLYVDAGNLTAQACYRKLEYRSVGTLYRHAGYGIHGRT